MSQKSLCNGHYELVKKAASLAKLELLRGSNFEIKMAGITSGFKFEDFVFSAVDG